MEKNQVLSGFAAFGGGRYQCPGRYSSHYVGVASCTSVLSPLSYSRWYALMEIQLFTAVVLRMFDMELMDPIPTVVSSLLHVVQS